MRRVMVLGLLALFTCFSVSADDDLPNGFVANHLNGSIAPITKSGITTFAVREGECSSRDYGNGTGENDCLNGSVKSQIVHEPRATLGDTIEYAFDVLVPKDFAYAGEFISQSVPFRPDGWDSKLRIAGWEGLLPKNFIYMLKLDSTKGLTFFGKECQAPGDFGQWVRFSLKVKWANDEKGWVKASCDDRIVFAAEGTSSTAQIQCYQANECDPGVVQDPREILFALGVAVNGSGYQWKEMGLSTPFADLPDAGVSVQMRNIKVAGGAKLYEAEDVERAKALQTALNALGCDVGAADGIIGKRTREQALTCRKFPEGSMPEGLTVASLGEILKFYTSEGVADLPVGKVPAKSVGGLIEVSKRVRAVVEQEGTPSPSIINATIMGSVEETKFKKFDLLLEGLYNVPKDQMLSLSIRFSDDVGDAKPNLGECGGRLVRDRFGKHVLVKFTFKDGSYALPDGECFARALPGRLGEKVSYVVTNFGDIAVGLIRDEVFIQHEGLKKFVAGVAIGKVTMGKI